MDTSSSGPPTDHSGLEVLSLDECRQLLDTQQIGRIAFISTGEPLILPVTYRMHRGHIVFRTTTGEKLDAARNAASVGFEIDEWDASDQSGWSVIVGGTAQDVEDPAEITELKELGLRPWADTVARNNWVRIIPNEISGRRI